MKRPNARIARFVAIMLAGGLDRAPTRAPMCTSNATRRGVRGGFHGGVSALAVLGAVFGATASAFNTAAYAQVLDLDGAKAGPTLPAENAATELSQELTTEAAQLERAAAGLTGEARDAALAKARLRRLAAIFFELSAAKSWNESGPSVAGIRLVAMLGRVDALVDATASGRRLKDGMPLPQADAQRAAQQLGELAKLSLDRARAACSAKPRDMQRQIAEAMAETLAPLVELCAIVEESRIEDAWPLVDDGKDVDSVRAATRADIESMRKAADQLAADAGGPALLAALDACVARGTSASALSDLRLVREALATLEWLAAEKAERPPRPIPDAAIARATARITLALEDLAIRTPAGAGGAPTPADSARTRLASLEVCVRAARTMLSLREDPDLPQASRQALSDAAAALIGAELTGDERARARVAKRILDACAAADRLVSAEKAEVPRDLKDVARALDRDGRIATKALPVAFAAMAEDPSRAADPDNLSALERVLSIDVDRARIARMQLLIDRIGAIDAKSGRAFVAQMKRTAKVLLDPLKRGEAQAVLATLDAQAATALPFPYEDELKRRTDRALTLTGGRASDVAEAAGRIRAQWAIALSAGNFNGIEAMRLTRTARLCACLRALDQVEEAVNRPRGDRLALWGGWASRRAALAPATQDLIARSVLACQSLLATSQPSSNSDQDAQCERDVAALERAIPLVSLVARIERMLSPALPDSTGMVSAMLAPLVQAPAPDAFLADEWTTLASVDRALFESEYARRKGDVKLREELAAYIAELCREITARTFGTALEETTPMKPTPEQTTRDRTSRDTPSRDTPSRNTPPGQAAPTQNSRRRATSSN